MRLKHPAFLSNTAGPPRSNNMADPQNQIDSQQQDPMLAAFLKRKQSQNAEAVASVPASASPASASPTPTPSGDDPMLRAFQDRQKQTTSAAQKPPAESLDAAYAQEHPMADEYAKSFGLKGAHTSVGEAAQQLVSGLGDAVKQSNAQAAKWTGEGQFGPTALALTVPNLITNGIEGIANLLQDGVPMIVNGLKNGDDELAYRGMGKVLGAITQTSMMRDTPAAGTGLAKAATEYNPKSIREAATGTGSSSPMNVFQGPINRSLGALVRDVRYGDPSKALVDNGITSPTTSGRLQGVTAAINQLRPQVDAALAASPKKIDIIAILDPIVKKATDEINDAAEKPEAKLSAHEDVNAMWMNALRKAPSGIADMQTANAIKQMIGDTFNWEKRPTAMMPYAEIAFRNAYGMIKEAINKNVPEVAEKNENLSNLISAKNALIETFARETTGAGPEMIGNLRQMVSEGIGKIAPWAIRTAQKTVPAVPTAVRAGIGVSAAAQNQDTTRSGGDPFASFGGIVRKAISSLTGEETVQQNQQEGSK